MPSASSLFTALLAGALAAGGAAPPRPFNDFSASRDGFSFVNHFTGSSLPGPLILLHKTLNAPDEFGLCGGMCFAAADFYLAGRSIPSQTTRPKRGQPLFDYIYQRQADSFGPKMTFAAKFSHWMNLPDTGPLSAGRATLGELGAVIDSLAQRQPVHLGLVYVSSAQTREPWNNHQVVATTVTFEPECSRGVTSCSLAIYDPNFPGSDAVRIDVQLTLEGFDRIGHDRSPIIGATCTQAIPPRGERAARTRNVRGMFPMPYEAKSPPENLR